MSKLIGQASIDERGNAYGGTAGDQTGNEVHTRSWYDAGWNVVLRPKSRSLAEAMAHACEAGCANHNVGYDQYQRNSLRIQAEKSKWKLEDIAVPCETDCSAFMTVCYEAAKGKRVDSLYDSGNAPTTWTMPGLFQATGDFELLTDSKYLRTHGYLMRGDILVNQAKHTAMYLDASNTQDPTPPSESTPAAICKIEMLVLSKGDVGPQVESMQHLLINKFGISCGSDGPDGDFGPNTEKAVKEFQAKYGLERDGVAGANTLSALIKRGR